MAGTIGFLIMVAILGGTFHLLRLRAGGSITTPQAPAFAPLANTPTATGTSTPPTPTSDARPEPRLAPAMTYDGSNGRLLLFSGGRKDGSTLDDTWSWDGKSWNRELIAVQPHGRRFGKAVYDAGRGNVVLFGGSNETKSETWTWDGAHWNKQHPSVSPPVMPAPSLAYDRARNVVLLFGTDLQGTVSTWIWDGSTWAQKHPAASPSRRLDASMAYDEAHKVVVVFGGLTDETTALNDTWLWDGSNWKPAHTPHSPPRGDSHLAYDPLASNSLLYVEAPGLVSQTWTWNGSDWSKLNPATSPGARAFAAMAFDRAIGSVVLYGGKTQAVGGGRMTENLNSETWIWDGKAWTEQG